ncbi:MAG TPA: ornithine carbamoyltransferase [Acidimicrobiales bacterium]|nr:ornithine carbamoyltransferase [Acidimicrobiales bacterium]
MTRMTRHLLDVDDLTGDEVRAVLHLAGHRNPPKILDGRGVALVFEKPSLRTRNSTEMAVVQLGGHPLSLQANEVGLGARETPEDVARTLERYHAAICARVFEHDKLERMAAVSSVPVVNLLSDQSHPLQALADLLTIDHHFGSLEGRTVAYIGDANNVARSLALACARTGMAFRYGCPPGYGPSDAELDLVAAMGGVVSVHPRPAEAADGADVVYTDVWASMGKEEEAEARRRAFEGYTIDAALMEAASPQGIFLHCLPAHRGEEVDAAVIDGSRSLVWQQAENRMHTARAALMFLVELS